MSFGMRYGIISLVRHISTIALFFIESEPTMALYPYTPFEKVDYPCYWLAYDGTFWTNEAAQATVPQEGGIVAVETFLRDAQNKSSTIDAPYSLALPGGDVLTILPIEGGLLATGGNETLLSTALVGSHLRESLTGIFAILPLLSRKIDQSGLLYTEEIQNSCYGLLRLASNLENSTSLTKPSSLQHPLDFSVLVESLFQSMETVCQQQNIKFTADIPDIPLPVRGDKRLLTEAILNIIRNSMQYTQERNHIHLRLLKVHGKALLTIQDRGLGIQPEHLPHIFSPYFSADPYGDGAPAPGAGLGLTVASQVAHRLGGTITAESQFGKGTRISISLPLDSSDNDALGSDAADYLLNRYSPVYVQLSGFCRYPDL